jgi:hypothetical protein
MRPPGHQGIRASSHQAIRPSSHPAIRPSGHQAIRPSGHQAIRPSGHQAIRPSGHQAIQPSGRGGIAPPRAAALMADWRVCWCSRSSRARSAYCAFLCCRSSCPPNATTARARGNRRWERGWGGAVRVAARTPMERAAEAAAECRTRMLSVCLGRPVRARVDGTLRSRAMYRHAWVRMGAGAGAWGNPALPGPVWGHVPCAPGPCIGHVPCAPGPCMGSRTLRSWALASVRTSALMCWISSRLASSTFCRCRSDSCPPA